MIFKKHLDLYSKFIQSYFNSPNYKIDERDGKFILMYEDYSLISVDYTNVKHQCGMYILSNISRLLSLPAYKEFYKQNIYSVFLLCVTAYLGIAYGCGGLMVTIPTADRTPWNKMRSFCNIVKRYFDSLNENKTGFTESHNYNTRNTIQTWIFKLDHPLLGEIKTQTYNISFGYSGDKPDIMLTQETSFKNITNNLTKIINDFAEMKKS